MTDVSRGVRPTQRCLSDLDVELPDLTVPLDEVEHPVVVAGQSTPEQRDAGGAERVVSLRDRVWFKVKTRDHRAAATELTVDEKPQNMARDVGSWWIGCAGRRQDDSPQRDFYAALQRECTSGSTVSTAHLLPREWDWKRLIGEGAVAWRREMRRLVVRLIGMSLRTGHLAVATFRSHRLKALVRADHGHESYLAIIAEGVPHPEVFALLLDCVPGVSPDDWQLEPSPVPEMEPVSGELIWSTLLPSEVAGEILERYDADSE